MRTDYILREFKFAGLRIVVTPRNAPKPFLRRDEVWLDEDAYQQLRVQMELAPEQGAWKGTPLTGGINGEALDAAVEALDNLRPSEAALSPRESRLREARAVVSAYIKALYEGVEK